MSREVHIKGGKVNMGITSHEKNMQKYPDLIFTSSPEFESIYADWNKHLKQFEDNQSDEFKEERYKIGKIPFKNIKKLKNSLLERRRIPYSIGACDPNYVASCMSERKEREWAQHLPNFDFSKKQLGIVKDIAEQVQPIIESCIGPFRIINTKASETLYSSGAFGPNAPHTDSMYPIGTYKVFIYLTPPNEVEGTTVLHILKNAGKSNESVEKIFVEGDLGTFLFFDPVYHRHCGIVPRYPNIRMMLEFIIVPYKHTLLNPSFNGTNSTHPIDPEYGL